MIIDCIDRYGKLRGYLLVRKPRFDKLDNLEFTLRYMIALADGLECKTPLLIASTIGFSSGDSNEEKDKKSYRVSAAYNRD